MSILSAREQILALSLIVLSFMLNLSIASRSPFGGGMDEVTYVDPGLNLAAGKGWKSSTYPFQTDRELFAGTSPLFPGGLSLWSRIFGVSMVAARSYCYFLGATGTLLFWLAAYRFDLLTPALRLFWIVLLSTEYAMNWMMRDNRYDVWVYIGLGGVFLGASLHSPWQRFLVIFTGSFLIPFGGFVGVPYLFLVATLAGGLTKLKLWKEAATAMTGALAGVFAVLMFFASLGLLGKFREILGHMTVGEQSRKFALYRVFTYPTEDPSVFLMIAVLVVLTVYGLKCSRREFLPWLGLAWGMLTLLPCVMVLRGVFTMMYLYLLIVPISLSLLQLVKLADTDRLGHRVAVGAILAMAIVCLGGLPARLYTSWKEWDFRDPRHMREFVRTYIRPDDSVFSENFFYFELRDYVRFFATPFYYDIIPADEARQVDVVLVRDGGMLDLAQNPSLLSRLGDGWKKVAVFPTPEMRANSPGTSYHETYTLYRRDVIQP